MQWRRLLITNKLLCAGTRKVLCCIIIDGIGSECRMTHSEWKCSGALLRTTFGQIHTTLLCFDYIAISHWYGFIECLPRHYPSNPNTQWAESRKIYAACWRLLIRLGNKCDASYKQTYGLRVGKWKKKCRTDNLTTMIYSPTIEKTVSIAHYEAST